PRRTRPATPRCRHGIWRVACVAGQVDSGAVQLPGYAMSRVLMLLLLSFAFTAVAAAADAPATPPAAPGSASAELHRFFDAEWERGLRESPETASYRGDARYNDRWSDLSPAAIAARQAADRTALAQLRAIDRGALPAADQLSYDVMAWQLEKSVERQQYREYQRAVSQRGGVQTAEGIAEVLPFATVKDYRDWLARMRGIPAQVDATIVLLRGGMAAGNVPPRVLMERIPGQFAAQVVADPARSPFYRPFTRFRDGVPAAARAELVAEARTVVAGDIVPAYRRFAEFFEAEYLPATRETIAAADLPGGSGYYD